MSHAIIPDHRDRALSLENVVNRMQKHCRITNVRWKPSPAPASSSISIGSPMTTGGRFVTSSTDR